jgi:endonuclease YncB( thermonuclease family)
VGLDDRDYMRKRPLRYDERSGELRFDDGEPPRQASAWQRLRNLRLPGRWLLIGVVAAALGLAGGGYWMGQAANPLTNLVGSPPSPPVTNDVAVAPPPQEAPPAAPEDQGPENPVLVGTVTRVIDGDTIEVKLSSGPIRVRLGSIDAPEHDQPWGKQSKAALTRKLGHREVALDVVEQREQYNRMVAVVFLGDENIDEWMVRQGNAWAYRQYARDKVYCELEGEAHAVGRGLWGLPRDQRHAPWEWRSVQRHRSEGFTDYADETVQDCINDMHQAKEHRGRVGSDVSAGRSGAAVGGDTRGTAETLENCRIKGNISSNGKIYHVPGSANYERTVIDTSKGERMFCTEEEARAAGWRAPKH